MTESRFTAAELRRVMAYGECYEEVIRKGHTQPCDTRAPMVTLAEIVAAITEADQ